MLLAIERARPGTGIDQLNLPVAEDILDELYPLDDRKYVLFKQGARKTNMAFVELVSLLQLRLEHSKTSRQVSYQFISESEALEYIAENLRLGVVSTDHDLERLSQTLSMFFSEKIILRAFYTSVALYIPTGVTLDLARLTAESGYIHSCGDLVFAENTQILTPKVAHDAIARAINKLSDNERFLLVPYCHEDFSSRDRGESEFLKNGLDDVKLNISKSYLSEIPLHQFLLDVVGEFSERGTSAPTNYKASRERFAAKFKNKDMVTIWLVSDSEVTLAHSETLGDRNLICYRQRYKNDNPYHHYEENKPAWVSHTTLPHSLAGAMINVARPWFTTPNPVICDPFCGSGTIYLEAQKFPIMTCFTSDQSPLADEILHDNIKFFQLNEEELKSVIDGLELAGSPDKKVEPKSSKKKSGSHVVRLEKVVELIDQWSPECDGDFLNLNASQVSGGLSKIGKDLVDRILLYVALRASVRGRITVDREEADWTDVFERELKALLGQMRNHLKSVALGTAQDDAFAVFTGSYSSITVPSRPYDERKDLFGSGEFSLRSVERLPSNAYDAIICDPPYGFNTETDRWGAEDFANMMVPALVGSLKRSGGQIVLAAPRTSFSGRKIPLTLRSDYISKSILSHCSAVGLKCWKPSMVLPEVLSTWLHPPYYWTAEKTLTRKILHFWIRA